jgi:hypothetical protein
MEDFNSSGEDEYISDSEVTVKFGSVKNSAKYVKASTHTDSDSEATSNLKFGSVKDSLKNIKASMNTDGGVEKAKTIAFSHTKEIKGVNNETFYSELTKSYDEGDFESASR